MSGSAGEADRGAPAVGSFRQRPPTVSFLIRSLNRGGAERQLSELASRLGTRNWDVEVLTFYPGGAIWDELSAAGHVRLRSLSKVGRWDLFPFLWRLVSVLRITRPAILHCYLTEPSVFGLLAGRLAGVPAIVWGIRASNMDYTHYGAVNRFTFRTAALLSRGADLIISNSDAGRAHAVASGFSSRHLIVIRNGIDTSCYQPSSDARLAIRREWGLQPDDVAVGIAARLDPMKGYETFLDAAALVAARAPQARFICIGGGPDAYTRRLRDMAEALGLGGRLTWVAEHPRMAAVYPGLDIVCSSSRFGEGFSNTIGEAMACGVPCVVTNVGDSALVVGATGAVVLPEKPAALADAIMQMVMLSPPARLNLGASARKRVLEHFGTERMVADTARAYAGLGVHQG